MTNRHAGYMVVLEESIREDDAKHIITALSQVKGVISVEPVVDDLTGVQIGEARAEARWRRAVLRLMRTSYADR